LPLPLGGHHFADQPLIRLWQPVVRGASGGGARLGWISSALLVYWVLQTRTLRLRLFNGVASALLVIFNAAIAVWPMVALNVRSPRSTFSLSCGCYTAGTTHEPSRWSRSLQTRAYLEHLLHEFDADIQHFNLDSRATMQLAPISASSSSLERRRWAWCWPETQVTDQRSSSSTTSCRGISALPWVSSSTVPVVRSPRGATEE
jgi:hypothetical protein